MIIPAILEKNWEEIEKKIEICRNFTRNLHIDFIDGKFINNPSFFDFGVFKKYSDFFNLEAHLMVEEPINYLDKLSEAGFKTFLGHVEKMTDQVEFIAKGELLGQIGLCLDLSTPLSQIKVSLDDLDRVLLMCVPAGKSGQKFDEKVLLKINQLSQKTFSNIEVDGGIDDKTIVVAKKNGANIFCVNSFLFDKNAEENYLRLEDLI